MQPDAPFRWASGWYAPIYCDNRISLSYPKVRNFLRERLAEGIQEKYPGAEAIAGVATGAIAISALVAQQLNLPLVYVRPEPKKHGRQNQIEGHLEADQKVVVIEDLISTGGSSLKAVEALRDHRARVQGMAALFTYGFDQSVQRFAEAQCPLFTLSDYPHLLQVLRGEELIDLEQEKMLAQWRQDPENWKQNA